MKNTHSSLKQLGCNNAMKEQEGSGLTVCRCVLSSVHTVKEHVTPTVRLSHSSSDMWGVRRGANKKQRVHGCVLNEGYEA